MNIGMILFMVFILLLGSTYSLWHVWQMLPFATWGKWLTVAILVGIIGLIFVNASGWIDKKPMPVAIAAYETGWSSLFILLYAVMLFVVFDVLRLVKVLPSSFFHDSIVGSLTTLAILAGVFLYANWHYMDKKKVALEMPTSKRLNAEHKIIMLSDLHIGYHNRADEVSKWVDLINKENPELVLISGDIIDGSIRAVNDQNFIEAFKRIKAPVYACLGNHEYYGGEDNSKNFYKQTGIHLLIDDWAKIPLSGGDTIAVIGRDDRTNRHRASINTLMKKAPKGLYTVLLDHQPYHLEAAERAGIDFQLSGHTHYGQVFPINLIEDVIYEDAYGPLQKGKTQYYVSSGMGIWGAKFRIGTQSEYILGTLKSNN